MCCSSLGISVFESVYGPYVVDGRRQISAEGKSSLLGPYEYYTHTKFSIFVCGAIMMTGLA